MKILAIRGNNLASLAGDFEIDLSRAPFTDTGLFAIVGNTGAGKSTLLDALCVALFDRTPRLTNHSRVTVGRGDDDPATLGASDARTLLRRGAPSGFAEVDFESGDARRYRARWSVRRARNQTDGAIQDQQLSLLALDSSERLGGTKTETLKAISSRLGLSFDQFRRSALLAQNDFAAFLRADGRDRSELLERMTGTEIYSRLSIEAHLRAALAEQRLRDTRAAALAIPILEETAHAAAESELALATSARSAARARLDDAELAARWLAEAAARRSALAVAASEHSAATSALASAEPDRRELELRQRAEKLRSVSDAAARLDRELVVARSHAAALAGAADTAHAARNMIAARRSELVSLLEPLRAGRIAAGVRTDAMTGGLDGTPRHGVADVRSPDRQPDMPPDASAHVGSTIDAIAAMTAGRGALRDAEWLVARGALSSEVAAWNDIDARFARHASIIDALATIDRSLVERDAARAAVASTRNLMAVDHQAATSALVEAQRKAGTFQQRRGPSLDAARKQEDQARGRVADAERLIEIATAARQATATRVAIDTRIRELTGAEARDREARCEAETTRDHATVLRGERTRVADELRRAAGYAHARTELRDGEPCPLCGAEAHPWRDRGALDDVIATAQARLDETLAQHAAAVGTLAAIAARDEQRAGERHRLDEQRATAHATAADARTAWRDQLASGGELILDGDPSTPSAEQLAAERCATARKQLDVARAGRAHAEATAKAATDAQAEVQLAQANVDQLAARLAELGRSLAEIDNTVQRLHGERAGRIERLAELGASLGATIDRWMEIDRAAGTPPAASNDDALETALRHSLDLVRRQHPHEEPAKRGSERDLLGAAPARPLDPPPTPATRDRSLDPTGSLGATRAEPIRGSDDRAGAPDSTRSAPPIRLVRLDTIDRGDLPRARDTLFDFVGTWHERATRVARAEAWLAGLFAAIERAVRETERAATELGGQLATAHQRYDALTTELAVATAALGDACATAGFELEALRTLLEGDGARTEQLAARLASLDAAVVRTRAIAGERSQLVADHEATRPAPDVLADAVALDELATANVEAEQHAARLAATLAADADARGRRATALAAVADDETRVEIDRVLGGVIGSHDGKLFRSFAQSLTLDALLAVANAHLDELAPRYQLERIPRHDLEIQVIDRDLGAEVRSVQSLSGGESFLVSLALALGLSSMSAHDVRVRTLLIDEGFGTLDPTALDSALAVLDTLQATGRQIGVISHVPALVERVGAHVRVVQRGGGRSEVVVRA